MTKDRDHYKKAISLMRNKDYTTAIEKLDLAIRIESENTTPEAQMLSQFYRKRAQCVVLKSANSEDSKDEYLQEAANNLAEAIANEQKIKTSSRDPRTYVEMGIVQIKLRQWEEALKQLNLAIHECRLTNSAAAYYHRGIALNELGVYREARLDITTAMILNPKLSQQSHTYNLLWRIAKNSSDEITPNTASQINKKILLLTRALKNLKTAAVLSKNVFDYIDAEEELKDAKAREQWLLRAPGNVVYVPLCVASELAQPAPKLPPIPAPLPNGQISSPKQSRSHYAGSLFSPKAGSVGSLFSPRAATSSSLFSPSPTEMSNNDSDCGDGRRATIG